jgi:hypothetical protein
MTKHERIFSIEEEIRQIFAKDSIKRIDVVRANNLLDTWKLLTDYTPNTRPVIQESDSNMLDNEPEWIRNPKFIKS